MNPLALLGGFDARAAIRKIGGDQSADVFRNVNVGNAAKQVATGRDYNIFPAFNTTLDNGVPVNRPVVPGEKPPVDDGNGNGDVLGSQITGSMAPGGGSGSAYPVLNRGAVDNTQLALDQLPALLEAALAAERSNKANILNEFNAHEQAQRGTYDRSTTTNQQNYDANYMDAIRAGIKGVGSLMSILRGNGGAGGTAEGMVQDTVGGVTANDIRTGADTREANQNQLDTSLSTFMTELQGKRRSAEDTFVNNERAIRRDNATQMQDLLGKMAGYYGDAGMTNEANSFMSRAGQLTPEIANNSKAQVSVYDRTPVAVKAPQLSAFQAPTQPDVAVAPENGQVGSGIFTMNRRKEQQQEIPTPLPAGV